MTKPLHLLRRFWLEIVAIGMFAFGVYWRHRYIFKLHDPRKYIYSDMKMYFDLGTRLARPGYEPKPSDVTHPPGMSELLGWFAQRDAVRLGILDAKDYAKQFAKATEAGQALGGLVTLQFVIACLVPLALLLLGWATYGKRTGLCAMALGSVYYPFVEYGGYFLAEIYMMLLVPLVVGLYFIALRVAQKGGRRQLVIALGIAAVTGVLFSAGLSMKMVALPGIVGFLIIHFLFTKGPPRWMRAAVITTMMTAAAPGIVAISDRCTTANEGNFCLGSSKSSGDFLLAHYGRIQGIAWKPKKGAHFSFGSPSAYQHGYRDVPEVPFAMTDSAANSKEAWRWIRKHPDEAVVLSLEHIADIFVGALPWPAYATKFWMGAQVALYLFIAFVFFPTGVLLVDVLRQRGVLGLVQSKELAIVSPIFGVIMAVAAATGEIRYRLPWDGMFIVLAVEFYRRLRVSFREVAPGGAPSGVVPADEMLAAEAPATEPADVPAAEPGDAPPSPKAPPTAPDTKTED